MKSDKIVEPKDYCGNKINDKNEQNQLDKFKTSNGGTRIATTKTIRGRRKDDGTNGGLYGHEKDSDRRHRNGCA